MQAAIAHARFETTLPFTDGNGRTGRAIIHVTLRTKGLLRNTTARYFSAGLLRDTNGYFRALTSYREGDADVLAERTGQRRNHVWIHEGILQALDDYADQLRR